MLQNVDWIEVFVVGANGEPLWKRCLKVGSYILGESHYFCNQENSVKYTEVSKYRRETCSNLRLKYILGILSRKFRNSRPERKFNDGLIVCRQKQPVTSQVSE